VAEFGQQTIGRALQSAAVDDGKTPTTTSRRCSSTSRTPGTRSRGSIEISGLDGAMTMREASRRAASTSASPSPGRPHDVDRRHRDVVVVTNEVLLEAQSSEFSVEDRGQRVIRDR